MKVETLEEALSLLKEGRSRSDTPLSEVATKLEVDRAILSRWISGQKVPSLARWLECLSVFGYALQASPVVVDQEVTAPQTPLPVEALPKTQPDPLKEAPEDFFRHRDFLCRQIACYVYEGHPESEALGYFKLTVPDLTPEHIRYAVKAGRYF